MSLASISIRNPVFAWMLMAGFIVFGAIAFQRLPVGQYPDIDIPVLTIRATLEGAAPEIMESDVVDVLEDAVMAVEGIRELKSTCKQGEATITLEFHVDRNIDVAIQDVQARVAQAQRQLPVDMEPVVINKTNPEENPIMWVALSGTRAQQEISEYARNILRDRFLTVEGNGDVMMGGYLQRNMRIWLDPKGLEARGLSADDVIAAMRREHIEAPAGRLEGPLREANVRVEGEALNAEAMRGILIATRNGAPIYLRDVALVEDGFEDRRRTARVNGFPAQGLGIIKQHGANSVEVADGVKARIVELRKNLPEGLTLDVRVDSSKFIKDAVHEIGRTLVLAVILTALVCWFFLGSISPTFNVVLAIPVSVFGTFAVMHFAGFSLNTFSLLALSLSIGIVVDDAVMVLENIYRHAEMGKDKVSAAREGTEQITFAALAATLAIIAIFLPVAFMGGIIGLYFFQFGVVLSVAVAISLLEALTLAPSRCAQFLQVGHRGNIIERAAGHIFGFLASLYRGVLGLIINFKTGLTGKALGLLMALAILALGGGIIYLTHANDITMDTVFIWLGAALVLVFGLALLLLVFRRAPFPTGAALVMVGATALFAGSLQFFKLLPFEMVPPQDQGFYRIDVTTPVGATIDYTDSIVREIEAVLEQRDELESVFAIAGGMGGDANAGLAFVTLKDRKDRTITQQQSIIELRKLLDGKFPGCRVTFRDPSQDGFGADRRGASQVEFSVRGPDWDTLGELSEKFLEEMRASGVFVDVDTDYRKGMPEVQVLPNREKTLAHNVDIRTLTETVSALVGGMKVAKYKDNGRRYDVRVRLLKEDRARPEDIGSLFIRNRDGQLIRISEVADIVMRPSLQSITRQARQRSITIKAAPAPGFAQGEALQRLEQLRAQLLPPGYSLVLAGSAKTFKESFDSLRFALLLGLVVAYMVLASQFNSFIHPFTVLLALPFSISGALLGLYLMNQSLNVYSMIGLILLMGIVKKNSILLVDYTNQVRETGVERDKAIIEACPVRLRPILMTSVATIAGAIPGALSTGAGGELYVPMSVSVIGGLSVSTLLTLLVVPCFYSIMDEARVQVGRLIGSKDENPQRHVLVPEVSDVGAAGK